MYILCQIYVIDSADRKRFEETGVVSAVLLLSCGESYLYKYI